MFPSRVAGVAACVRLVTLRNLDAMRRLVWHDGPRIPSLVLYALFALSLLGGMGAVLLTLQAERAERTQVERTNAILLVLRSHGRALIDAETGQRGYIITGDRAYLAPYHAGSQAWTTSQENIERLLDPVATPRQRQLLAQSRSTGAAKLAELALAVDMVERGDLAGARAQVQTDKGLALMDRYRNLNNELEMIERNILADAMARSRTSEGRLVPLLLALGVVMIATLVVGLWQTFRMAEAEAEARMAQSLAEARDRADLLSRELNHRVKNLFAVITAIVRMTLRPGSDPVEARDAITQRINALSLAHNVTQGQMEAAVADLEELVRTTIAPYVEGEDRLAIAGPKVQLAARQVTPLGLILHELVTNCVKYGCWSADGGRLAIDWTVDDAALVLTWREQAATPPGEARGDGFGTRMIEASARQIGGSVERTFTGEGMILVLRAPLEQGEA